MPCSRDECSCHLSVPHTGVGHVNLGCLNKQLQKTAPQFLTCVERETSRHYFCIHVPCTLFLNLVRNSFGGSEMVKTFGVCCELLRNKEQ